MTPPAFQKESLPESGMLTPGRLEDATDKLYVIHSLLVLGRLFQSSFIFMGKAFQVLQSRVGSGFTANIRLGWKGLPGTNALAYYKNS
jgi:hypothetical protein